LDYLAFQGGAERVKSITERYLYRAHDPRWAEYYKYSQAWLRIEFLAQVLQEDCGVHYNMERLRNIDFKNSKDLFIHSMIDDPNGGTCVSGIWSIWPIKARIFNATCCVTV
jgi:hypothetical protein